jgi:hypothetical protein
MLNDNLGDCTIAACGHAAQIWTANTGEELTVSDAIILGAYEKWCGYQPNNPNTDNGGIELDVLKDFMKDGLGGVGLDAFTTVNINNLSIVKACIMLLGGVYIGLNMPLSAQNQDVWDLVPDAEDNPNAQPGSWGGHAVFVPAYDGDVRTVHHLTAISWGQLFPMTKPFWEAYVDEGYGLVSPAWIGANGQSPGGFDLAQLLADRSAIK